MVLKQGKIQSRGQVPDSYGISFSSVSNLAKPGTFAGNDAIVAFARNHEVNVIVHQPNAPLWQIQGTERSPARELHVACRHGELYDSVRSIDDDSEAPAWLRMEMLCKNGSKEEQEIKPQKGQYEDGIEDEVEDAVQKVCDATECLDIDLINQILQVENYNVESAIFAVMQVNEVKRISAEEQCDSRDEGPKSCGSALWEENGSGSRILGKASLHQDKTESKGEARCDEENRANRITQVSKKQKKEQQLLEKKKRQEERHRQKVLANKSNWDEKNRKEMDSDSQVTLVKATAALNI